MEKKQERENISPSTPSPCKMIWTFKATNIFGLEKTIKIPT
jgi:hypothetical protein